MNGDCWDEDSSPASAEADGEAAESASVQLAALARGACDALDGVAERLHLTEQVEARPLTTVAAALGVGYVLGGGLFTPTTARLIRLGVKVAALPLVRERLLERAEAAVDAMLRPAAPSPAPASPEASASPET